MKLKMDRKATVCVGVLGGMVLLGIGAYSLWNCKQLRMMRAAKRAGKVLYKVGAVLQSLSGDMM